MHEKATDQGQDRDHRSDRNGGLPTRINPETGVEEVLLPGVLGPYWQERGRVTIDPHGHHIDWEG